MKTILNQEQILDILSNHLSIPVDQIAIRCETLSLPDGSWPIGKEFSLVSLHETEE